MPMEMETDEPWNAKKKKGATSYAGRREAGRGKGGTERQKESELGEGMN